MKMMVDDLVLTKNPLKPRPYWSLGRIQRNDHNVHMVKIKNGDVTILVHALKHFYLTELYLTCARGFKGPIKK